MRKRVTFGQLRQALNALGFEETRRSSGIKLQHRKSDTFFLFRPYDEKDRLQPGELLFVTQMLDERGLMEPGSFEALLTKVPAG
jgi:hypothetical protein